MKRTRLTALLLFLAAFALGKGENPTDYEYQLPADTAMSRPVTGVYSLETGRKTVLATYLSPLVYTGTDFAFSGAWSKAMPFSPEKAIMHFDGYIDFSTLENPAKTARMIGLMAGFKWGMSWCHTLPYSVRLTAGGTIGIDGGAYYLLRNGNNPVQAIANANIAARLSLGRPFRIGRLDILLRDVVSLPSLSLFFSPEYGEPYYEIYVGNHKGLSHAGWWGNNFRIDNLLSVTLDFGRTALMLGYRYKADTQWASHLNTKIHTHSFVIGVIPGGIGLKRRSPRLPATTIYSY